MSYFFWEGYWVIRLHGYKVKGLCCYGVTMLSSYNFLVIKFGQRCKRLPWSLRYCKFEWLPALDRAGRNPGPRAFSSKPRAYNQGQRSTPSVIPPERSGCHLPLHGEGAFEHCPLKVSDLHSLYRFCGLPKTNIPT